MAKVKFTTIEKVPDWATTYIAYGDESGLTEDDMRLVDGFIDGLDKKGLMMICPIDGTESEFEPYPVFGLASGTVDWKAEVLPSKFHMRVRRTMERIVEVKAHSKAEAMREALLKCAEEEQPWKPVCDRAKILGCIKPGKDE